MNTEKDDHGKQQAAAQLESIIEMVNNLRATGDDDEKRELAEQTIHEDPLSVEVRSGWYSPGSAKQDTTPEEFTILLCTGGPACRIIGELDEHLQPEKARIEYQDWFAPWTDYPLGSEQAEKVLEYCNQFYFGE